MKRLHQLFDPISSTYTYVVADPVHRAAVIIDPVAEQLERDLALLQAEDLILLFVLETHTHADHISDIELNRFAVAACLASPIPSACPFSSLRLSANFPV